MGFIPGLKALRQLFSVELEVLPGLQLVDLFLGMFESVGPGLFLEGLGIPAPHQLKDVIAFTMLFWF